MNEKKYNVIISDKAKSMIGSHIRFLAKASKEAANEKKKEIITAIHSLSEMPERFPYFNAYSIQTNTYHKMFIAKWYIVLYQIKDDNVYVDYVLDCRQDYSWLLN